MKAPYMAFAAVVSTSCALTDPAGPLPVTRYAKTPGETADTLLVLIPGVTDTHRDIDRRGVVRKLHERGYDVDVSVVGYVTAFIVTDTIVEQVWSRIVFPARERGYRRVFMLGISLGCRAVVDFAREHEGSVDGFVLFAPYLGDEEVVDEITAAGGLDAWSPADPNGTQQAWAWIGEHMGPRARPPVYVLWGQDDEVAPGFELVEEAAPPSRVYTDRGGHGWATFDKLWVRFLDDDPLGWS